jgi:hypothetical protein
MLNEIEIRHRKHELINLIDNENMSISKLMKEVDERKQRILDYQARINEVDKILKDS